MKHRILLKGPFLSLSGYGYQARFALEAIRSRADLFDIYIQNVGWGQTSWLTDDKQRQWIEEKIRKTIAYSQSGGKFDVNLQITIPNEIEQNAPVNILYTAGIETTQVAPAWLQAIQNIDKMIVVSSHSKQIFENTTYEIKNQHEQTVGNLKCETPIDVVNYCVGDTKVANPKLSLDYEFNFLTMAQWGPRKDVETLINSFLREFWNEEVGLVIKTFIKNTSLSDRRRTQQRLENMIANIDLPKDEKKCKVHLVHGAMSREELDGLYQNPNIGAFITTTHGEGFGLSMFESAYNAVPVVAPGWSGHMDFLCIGSNKKFTDVEFHLQPIQKEAVWEGVLQEGAMWSYVNPSDFRKKIRYVYNNQEECNTQAKVLQEHLLENFTPEKKYGEFVDSVLSVLDDLNLSNEDIDSWLDDMGVDLIEAD